MRVAIVTGAAGFIGSTLAETLVAEGWRVVGVDSFTPYYAREIKEQNLRALTSEPRFSLLEIPVSSLDRKVVASFDSPVIFHLAGQPGVRESWADGFDDYVANNVTETQHLLEILRDVDVGRVIYASSSSIYGDALAFPTRESALPEPRSPYGVSKHSGEMLVRLYAGDRYPGTVLRLFTVFGPRQRPDMAFHRLFESALGRTPPFTLYGDGGQVRDFTYVDDVVSAFLLAAASQSQKSTTLNIAGGAQSSLREAIALIGDMAGTALDVRTADVAAGDVVRTGGDVSSARRELGWEPKWSLEAGLREQMAWHRER